MSLKTRWRRLALSLFGWGERFDRLEAGLARLQAGLDDLVSRREPEESPLGELRYRDLLSLSLKSSGLRLEGLLFQAERPLAADSRDHREPRGTKADNTRSPRFVFACERMFPGVRLNFLDLGCAGGGLVLDFLLRGHLAAGVEGSDYSRLDQRAEWRLLSDLALFTADAARPFEIALADGTPFLVHVVTAWEFMEHIGEGDLPGLFQNVTRHLREDGRFIGSLSTRPADGDRPESSAGNYHRTVRPYEWWREKFEENGFAILEEHGLRAEDFCRGNGLNPYAADFGKPDRDCRLFVAEKRLNRQ
ncbi:MAG: class I SAM-dependent methyltransferase [Planctomycetota bacterium]|jgi:SAM-dependent methyltransferase|nr:class I SAM-dependent methyltransferase [Planctomycetota bacterium]